MSATDEASPGAGKERMSFVKRLLLFVLAPALIAGLFSILPKLYDELTKPTTILAYDVASGPSLSVGTNSRRIFSITIENQGKNPLNHIDMSVSSPSGQIESYAVEKSSLRPAEAKSDAELRVTVPKMLRNERFRVSVMILSNSPEPMIDISVRSDEAVGLRRESGATTGQDPWSALAGAVSAGLAVATMSASVLVMLRSRRRQSMLNTIQEKLNIIPEKRSYDRREVVRYIAGLSGLMPTSSSFFFDDADMSYARFAGVLLITGLRDPGAKDRCIAGLRALLLIKDIADTSVETIHANLQALGVACSVEQLSTVRREAEKASVAQTRQKILSLFEVAAESR